MTLLRWRDEYSVGIEAVDHEHRELIDLINRLDEELGGASAKATAPGFFGDLLKGIGISAHFALEEKLMRDQAYGGLASHKGDHERLLDDLRGIMQAFEAVQEIDRGALAQRLDAWFSNHFKTHDAQWHRAMGPHSH
jgi:hemerythrin